MNKLFTKLAAGFIGLTMVASVGAVIGSKALEKEPVEASAATTESFTITRSSFPAGALAYNKTDNWSTTSSDGTTISGEGDLYSTAAQTTMQTKNSGVSTMYHNTVATPGPITKISVSVASGTDRTYTAYMNKNTVITSTSGGTSKGTINGSTQLNLSETDDWHYFWLNCAGGASFLNSITVEYAQASAPKTATSIYALDPDANEIEEGASLTFDASLLSEYVVNAQVSYESGEDDSDYKITSTETAGLSIGKVDEEGDCAITFSNNGTYHLSIVSNVTATVKIDFTLTVSGVAVVEYEKYTSSIVAGDYVFMSDDPSSTYVMGNTVSNNRIANGSPVPSVINNKILSPIADYVWHIAKHGDYWTIQNVSNSKYLVATGTKNQAGLSDEITDYADWNISYDSVNSKWVVENVERRSASQDSGNRYLRNNGDSGWAAYSSTQSNAPALFKKVTNDPYITVEASGVTDLSVGGTVTLTATLTNTSGTVTWAIQDSSNVVSKIDNGNSTTVTGCLDGTAYVVASFTGCENVSTKITVKKALSSLAVSTEPDKTSYSEGDSFDGTGMVLTATYDDGSTKTNITTSTSGVTWSPNGSLSTADVKVTITYAEEGYGSVSVDQAITVTGREIDSIAVTKMPDKTVYSQNEPLDTTGIAVTATYVGGSTADVTASCTFAPETLTVVGTQTITVTFGSKTTTFNVTVNEITGPIANGRYFIANTHTESEVEVTKVLSGAKISAKADPVQSDKTLSRAWSFTLVANNSYTISENIDGEVYYLYVINDNAGVRSKICTENFPVWTIEINGNDFYTLSCSDGTQTRYLGAYNTGAYDFRSYKQLSAASTSFDIELIEEKDMYKDNFNNIFTEACDSQGVDTDIDALREAWPKAAAQFATLSEDNRNIIATTEDELTARYDKIIERYSTYTEITNFMGRSVSPAGYMPNMIINNNGDNTVSIIVIVTLVGITSVGVFFYIGRRRQHN